MSASDTTIDDDLIHRAAGGDCDAQRMIYEAFSGRIYRTMQRIVGEGDAADVTQDAFVQMFSKLSSFRGDSAFATWLHRLAVNQGLQHVRSRKRRTMKTRPLPTYEVASPQAGPVGGEIIEMLSQALERIEPELKWIFQLKAVDDLSYAQIGEIVGIPEGTVGSRLNRARKELRNQLLKLGWEP